MTNKTILLCVTSIGITALWALAGLYDKSNTAAVATFMSIVWLAILFGDYT